MNGNFNGTSVMENASEVQYARYAMHTFCVYQLIGKQPRMSIRIATKGRRMSLQMLACTTTVSVRPSSVVLCLLIHGVTSWTMHWWSTWLNTCFACVISLNAIIYIVFPCNRKSCLMAASINLLWLCEKKKRVGYFFSFKIHNFYVTTHTYYW